MVATNLTSLQVAGVPTMGTAGIPATTGNVWFVDSGNGADGNTGQADNPFSTLDYAIGRCTANNGDVIVLGAGHAETVSGASGITCDVAGVTIVGLGEGANRPRFTFSATASTIVISAASVQFGHVNGAGEYSIVLAPSIDAVVSPLAISGASCTVYVEHQDATDLIESTRVILTTAAADNLKVFLKHVGFTSGSGSTNAVRLVGANNAIINIDAYGLVGALGWVEFTTPASSNVQVYGYMYPSGSTNYSRDVVDTVGGSTWWASFYDGAAGASISGGSGAALAADDISTVAANQTVPSADSTANVLERDVVGNKTDAAVTAVGTTKSIIAYAKGLVTMNTVQSADSTANAFAGDAVGNKTDAAVTVVAATKSLMAYLKGAINWLTVGGADATANASAADVIGNKTDAAIYAAGTTKSLAAYAKGSTNVQESIVTTAAAVIAAGTATVFTVAGGPIEVITLISVCVSANDGTATLLKYTADPTDGSATDLCAASASLASVAAGTIVNITGTLANAAVIVANGTAISQAGRIVVPAGVITTITTGGATTGTWTHHLRYKPLARGVTVS